MPFLRKYGTAATIRIPLIKAGVTNHAVSADWTPAAGDVKIQKDGGGWNNVTTLPTATAAGNAATWAFALTATEMQAAVIEIEISDAATKAVEDDHFQIETFGNVSANIVADLSDGVRLGLTALPNAAAGASNGLPLSVDSSGRVDMLKINGISQTGRDIGASVLLSSGTGTGQLDFTNGVVKTNVTQLLGTAWLTPGTAGTPDVNVKLVGGVTQTGGDIFARLPALVGGRIDASVGAYQTGLTPLQPTVAGRTLDVSTGGEAGLDWANVGSPTTTLALTGTTIASTQKVDIETIKTNPVVNGGTVTFPTNATLASTTNITAGTITTTTNLTNLPAITSGWLTAAGIATDAFTAAKFAAASLDGKGDWLLASSYSAPPNAATVAAAVRDVNNTSPASNSLGAAVNTAAGGGGGGSGAYAITVTVTDGTNPLQNALVAISEGVTRHALSTDASGNADFSLNAATYDVTITKDGYDFTPTTRTVTGEQAGTLTDDLVMTQVAITASSDPLYCTVYGTFKHPDGTAGDGIVITATLYATGATTNAEIGRAHV